MNNPNLTNIEKEKIWIDLKNNLTRLYEEREELFD
jgi:hypothetical protein